MLNKVSACSGVTSWCITRIYLGPYDADMSLDISNMGGLWDALALFRRSRSLARKICVDAPRVCRVCIHSSNWRGESCTGDQGSSELVSPLKGFLPTSQEHSPPPLPRISKEGKGTLLFRQKCESLILNNRSTMQRMRFYGIAVGASSNTVVLDKSCAGSIICKHVQCTV